MALVRRKQHQELVHPMRDSYQLGAGILNLYTTTASFLL